MATWFEATVREVGEQVEDFLDARMLIFFGENAPPELREVSVVLSVSTMDPSPVLVPGRLLTIGQGNLTIEEVGSAAEENFRLLTHVVLATEGQAILPGQIRVAGQWPSLADVQPNSKVQILTKP